MLSLVLAGLAAIGPCANYQDPPPPKRPPAAPADTVKILPPLDVIGTIRPTAGPQIGSGFPARITTLTRGQLEAMKPRLLPEALGRQAGFSTYDDLGSPYKLNLSSRGFFASPVVGLAQGISVFLDGVRQNEPDAAQVNFDLLPMEHVERVEILSGNGSLLGRNSLGGAINLVTRRGEGPPSGELSVTGGTFGVRSVSASGGARSPSGLDAYAGIGYDREAGWRQATGAELANLFVNVGRVRRTGAMRLQLLAARSQVQTAGSLPASVYAVQPDSNLSANDFERLMNVQAAFSGYQSAGNGRVSFNVHHRRHRADRFNANQPDDPDAFGASQNDSYGAAADYRMAIPLGSAALGLRIGAEGSAGSTRLQLYADSTKFGVRTRRLTTNARSPIGDLGAFATGDLTVGRVTLSAGARWDYVRAPFQNRLDPSRDTTQTFARFNPRAGLDVAVSPGLRLFGSWGQAFRAPSVIEIACADPSVPCPLPYALGDDPPIKAVTAATWEAGVRWEHGPVSFSASAYRTDLRHEIVLLPAPGEVPGGSTINGYFGNVDRTRREGIEMATTAAISERAFGYLNYGYTRATFQVTQAIESPRVRGGSGETNTVTPGSRFPLVPGHQVKAGVQAPVLRRLSAGADVRYVGKQWLRGDEANHDAPLGGYVVTDAQMAASVGRWTLTVVCNNVFNRRYATFGTYNVNQGHPAGPTLERFLTPGQIRQVRVTARRAFGVRRD